MHENAFAKIVGISQKAKLFDELLIIGPILNNSNEFDAQFVNGPIMTNYNVAMRDG
jgi:hypothetical protein